MLYGISKMSCKQFNLPDPYVNLLLLVALHHLFLLCKNVVCYLIPMAQVYPFLKVQFRCCLHKFFPDLLQLEESYAFSRFPKYLPHLLSSTWQLLLCMFLLLDCINLAFKELTHFNFCIIEHSTCLSVHLTHIRSVHLSVLGSSLHICPFLLYS